jgi:hypothetical protein
VPGITSELIAEVSPLAVFPAPWKGPIWR